MIDTAAGARNHPVAFFVILALAGALIAVLVWAGRGSGRPTGTADTTAAASNTPWLAEIHRGLAGPVYARETPPVLTTQARDVCRTWRAGKTAEQVYAAAAMEYLDPSAASAARSVHRFVVLITRADCAAYAGQL